MQSLRTIIQIKRSPLDSSAYPLSARLKQEQITPQTTTIYKCYNTLNLAFFLVTPCISPIRKVQEYALQYLTLLTQKLLPLLDFCQNATVFPAIYLFVFPHIHC